MIGMRLVHSASGISGVVDAVTVDSSGRAMCRISDHWFFVEDCVAP